MSAKRSEPTPELGDPPTPPRRTLATRCGHGLDIPTCPYEQCAARELYKALKEMSTIFDECTAACLTQREAAMKRAAEAVFAKVEAH